MGEIDDEFRVEIEVAKALVGAPIDAIKKVGGGRNSRVYRIHAKGCDFALKQYPMVGDDPRDRLGTEVGALRLMEALPVNCVPRVVAADAARGFALLGWIEGVAVDEVTDPDIEAAVAFLGAVHALGKTPGATEQPLAAEACLSGSEIMRQIEMRLTRLRAVCQNEPQLYDFIEYSFSRKFTQVVAESGEMLKTARLDFTSELPQIWRSLVPSDFGFHNVLRRRDGSLVFLDFEYFGWDDPVKLIADIMLHPGQRLAPSQLQRFRRGAIEVYGKDQKFSQRLAAFLPLFGLRWVLILLNEFIPERWRHRVRAGASEGWSEAKARQLALSRHLLASLSRGAET